MSDVEKGTRGGKCNRRACQKPGAWWFNCSTLKHYCGECAELLNRANREDAFRLFGGPLCVLATSPDKPIESQSRAEHSTPSDNSNATVDP